MDRTVGDQVNADPEQDRRSHWFGTKVRELFGVDLRSLAIFRIGVGVLILTDLITRLPDLVAHYSDAGVLPRSARIAIWEGGSEELGFWWSLHMLSGDARIQLALFAIAALFAIWLILGYRTRFATVASWILLVSLQSRNPMVIHGGDVLLRCLLFWGMFLPLSACFSIDQKQSRVPNPVKRVLSVASLAILLQMCMVYVFTSLFKNQSVWCQDYSAVYYALSVDHFTTRIGQQVLRYPSLMTALTYVTFWLESLVAYAIFFPIATRHIRLLLVAAFVGLHTGIGLCMELGNFSWVLCVGWMLFLPSQFWDFFASFFRPMQDQLRSAESHALRQGAPGTVFDPVGFIFRRPERPQLRLNLISSLVCLSLVGYTVIWNLHEAGSTPKFVNSFPKYWRCLGHATYLCQRWDMFAPPMTEDGWFIIRGTLMDGDEVNLWEIGRPIPYDKPDVVSEMYPNARWRKYLMTISGRGQAEYRGEFTHWLSHRWNSRVSRESQFVDRVHISLQLEVTPPPFSPLPDPEEIVLWTWDYSPDQMVSNTSTSAMNIASEDL